MMGNVTAAFALDRRRVRSTEPVQDDPVQVGLGADVAPGTADVVLAQLLAPTA